VEAEVVQVLTLILKAKNRVMEINKQISKENSELCFEFDKIPLNILRGC